VGERGPVPKRSDQRIRRNKDDVPIEKVTSLGFVVQPPLSLDDPHPIIVDFWHSLADSAQAQYYEPSDWQFARFVMHHANTLVRSQRPSSQMFAGVVSALNDLLVTEGARRRVRMEIEREQQKAQVFNVAEMFRDRLAE
jgi:hypothetical protein